MSFTLIAGRNGVSVQRTNTTRPIPALIDEDKKKILVGYAFHDQEQELLDCGWEDDPAAALRYDGSFTLISWAGGVA